MVMVSHPRRIKMKPCETQISGCYRSRRAGGGRQWSKRQANRQERRQAKVDPENAPRQRRYYGYG